MILKLEHCDAVLSSPDPAKNSLFRYPSLQKRLYFMPLVSFVLLTDLSNFHAI